MILTLMGALAGAVLGLRFKVLVLVPVICVALAIVLVNGIARSDGVWWLAFTMIMIATALQLGYVLGIVVRVVINAARAPNHRRNSMPTSAGMSKSI